MTVKAGIVEQKEIARQWGGKHISMATNTHVKIEELLEAVFSTWPVLRLYNEDQWTVSVLVASRSPYL
jgi:hypothetical protein